MRVCVTHVTNYRYARPVSFNPHRLLVRPRSGLDLAVVSHELSCEPAATVIWGQDVFGNLAATATFTQRASTLVIASELVVETAALRWPTFAIAPRAQVFPFAYAQDEAADLGALADRAGGPEVTAWARGFVQRQGTDTLALLHDLNAGVAASATYEARDDEGVQTGAQTLQRARGSCRDFAALFIESARSLGFGARAVSGYLFDPDKPTERQNTTHAWAEVFLPDAGWIPFDPTHGRMGGAGLIPVASARRNEQIMPVVGSYAGAASDFLGMNVAVDLLGG